MRHHFTLGFSQAAIVVYNKVLSCLRVQLIDWFGTGVLGPPARFRSYCQKAKKKHLSRTKNHVIFQNLERRSRIGKLWIVIIAWRYIFYNLGMIKFTCHNSNDNNMEQEHFLVLFTPLKRKLMCKSTSTLVIIELAFLYTFDVVIEKVWEAYSSMLSFFNHISLLKKKKKNVCETFVVTGVESSPLIYSKRWNIRSSHGA